jgi:hypothetical protein
MPCHLGDGGLTALWDGVDRRQCRVSRVKIVLATAGTGQESLLANDALKPAEDSQTLEFCLSGTSPTSTARWMRRR